MEYPMYPENIKRYKGYNDPGTGQNGKLSLGTASLTSN
jgi:hypothetical protein